MIQLPRIGSYIKSYSNSSRPAVDEEAYPFTTRYFHKTFSEQGLSADGLSLEEIEFACNEYESGVRRERSDTDRYEDNQFFEDFVHDDDLSHDLKRAYDPEWGDDNARWSFAFVPNKKN
jgi:hypothetical protein